MKPSPFGGASHRGSPNFTRGKRATKMVPKLLKTESGFSLVEVVAAIVVFGIIAAIAVPVLLNQRKKGFEAEVTTALSLATTPIEQARLNNSGSYPQTLPKNIYPPKAVQFRYVVPSSSQYCLEGRHSSLPNKVFYVSSSSTKASVGTC